MKLTLEGIKEKKDWESAGVKLPWSYDIDTIVARTKESPEWVLLEQEIFFVFFRWHRR